MNTTWIAFLLDGYGNAQKVEAGVALNSIEAAANVMRSHPWCTAGDIVGIVTTDFYRAAVSVSLSVDLHAQTGTLRL